MSCSAFLVSAALWTVVHADGQNSLTGNFREDITLITGAAQLHDEYQIIWSHVQKVLINYDNREWVKNATNKYQLDTKTGSLTVRSLIANDSGLYQVQIFSGSKRTAKTFNLSVVGVPSKYPPTPAQTPSPYDASQTSSSADQRPTDPDPNPLTGPPHPLWIIGLVGLFLGLGVCTMVVIKNHEPIKVVVSHGHSEVKPVVGKAGADVRLVIGATEVNGDSHIIWSRGPGDKVIINCDRGTWLIKASEKFQLDANGSLMIRSLTANDSGLYWGQIFSNLWSSQKFNLTVVGDHWDKLQPPHSPELEKRKKMEDVEPDPKPPSAGPPQIRTH